MDTERQDAEPAAIGEQLRAIEKRIERIQFFTAWMLTFAVVGVAVGVIAAIVIANGVADLAGGSRW